MRARTRVTKKRLVLRGRESLIGVWVLVEEVWEGDTLIFSKIIGKHYGEEKGKYILYPWAYIKKRVLEMAMVE